MTSGQKIAFSLLTALGLFAGFVLSLHTTLFKELETRFYTQAKIEENTGQLDKISESCDSYISEILTLVEKGDNAWIKNASVRSYYVQNPSESDVNARRRLTETLFSEIPALNGIRIVDKNGRNVHYSSFDDSDLLKQNGISKVYKNYNDIVKDTGEIDFETLGKITSETKSVLLYDESRARLILSVPFCWVDGIYSGLSLFYLSMHEVEKELIARDVISLGEGMTLFADDEYNGGFVFNLPYGNRSSFREPALNYWKTRSEAMARGNENYQQPEKLLELPDGRFYVALSSNRIGKIRVSSVYTSDIFELSAELRLLIYICVFISILLIVFLIFSFFRDPVLTLQKRIKKLQLGIIDNYLDGKDRREWSDVARQLRNRRNDLSDEIIKSLHVHSKKRRKELSDYLEKNWDEIFAIFDSKAGRESSVSSVSVSSPVSAAPAVSVTGASSADISGASIAEIRRMLEEVLQNRGVTAVAAPVRVAEDVDELDEVEELAEDAGELDEVEELTEDAEELDELDELEEADDVEELDEAVDELDEVEELEEAVDELDEVEELEEAQPEKSDSDDAAIRAIIPPQKEFSPSNETYFRTENFADVENLFAEELKLGGEIVPFAVLRSKPMEFTIYPVPPLIKSKEDEENFMDVDVFGDLSPEEEIETEVAETETEIEELTEEVPSFVSEPDFAMTKFGDNFAEELQELKPALEIPKGPDDAIVEEDGVFSISENLEYTNVIQDPDFKNLVDSIL